jgi:hypothetical protein
MMARLTVGTDQGVFRADSDSGLSHGEDGPPSAAHLALADGILYALTAEGALWAQVGESAWRQVNARPVLDEVWSVAADPRVAGRLYLGVSPALVHRSDDGGETWTACESVREIPGYERWTFPPPPHIPHVRSIAADPRQAGALYIGAEEGGVYHSPDGGATWESLNDGLYWDVHTVTPTSDPQRLYATTGAGFHRSDDGGQSWRRSMVGLDRGYTVAFAVSPLDKDLVFVVAAAGPPPTWGAGANAALYRSQDGGERWTQVQDGVPPSFHSMPAALVVDGGGGLYLAAAGQVFASRDERGLTWRLAVDDLPAIRALIVRG